MSASYLSFAGEWRPLPRRRAVFAALSLSAVLNLAFPAVAAADEDHHAGGDHGAHEDKEARGPHGGRLLEQDGFSVEIAVHEDGTDPVFRLYPWRDHEPVAPAGVEAVIEITRLDGETTLFPLHAEDDYLTSGKTLAEPHSFDVAVTARFEGRDYAWHYESHEGRTVIGDQAAKRSGIAVAVAGPGEIRIARDLTGRLAVLPGAHARVGARYPGIVSRLAVEPGDSIGAGNVLAVVNSHVGSRDYDVRAPIGGTVVSRLASVGEPVGESTIFEIANLDRVAAEFYVFPRHMDEIAAGTPVDVVGLAGGQEASGVVERVMPVAEGRSEASIARVILDNAAGHWKPGLSVRGRATVDRREVPLAVRESAIQRFRDFEVVYAKIGETYEVRMIETGARDGEWVEVLGGLKPGTVYVSENSFLVKADIEKAGASHDH